MPIRLSAAERAQIDGAATRVGQPLSAFIRQAALQASAVVAGRVSVGAPRPNRVARIESEARAVALVLERDEAPFHHWVDGVCTRCGRDAGPGAADSPCAATVGAPATRNRFPT